VHTAVKFFAVAQRLLFVAVVNITNQEELSNEQHVVG
jgi:hypothetical protein